MLPIIALILSNSTMIGPSIKGETEIKISYKNDYTENDIINMFDIYDDMTPREKLKISFTKKLTLQKPGTYYNQLQVMDEHENVSYFYFKLEIIDDVPPIIYGPSHLEIYDNQNIDSILKFYTSFDQVNGVCSLQYNQNYLETSKLILYSYDLSNNVTNKIVSLKINQNIRHIKEIDLKVFNNRYQDSAETKKYLISRGFLENLNFETCNYINDNYSHFYDIVGIYSCDLELTYNKEKIIIHLNIYVQKQKDEIIKKEYLNDKIFLFLQNIFNWFLTIFTK